MGPLHLSFLDFAVGILLASFLVMPFATLVHELGHAVLALRFSVGRVTVQVGRPPPLIEVEGERLRVRWSPVPGRGVPFAGLCQWDNRYATDLEMMAVILAGPLLEALLVPLFLWATIDSVGSPHWLTATWLATALAVFSKLLINLDPRVTDEELRTGRLDCDGQRARAVYRAWRGP